MKRHIFTSAAAALLLCAASATASTASYATILTGPAEAPANSSPAIGAAVVTFDLGSHALNVSTAFSALVGDSTAAHIHCCTTLAGDGTAGVATQTPSFSGFPLGVKTGAYNQSFNTSLSSSWSADFLSANGGTTAGAEAALLAGLNAGSAYLNIHSSAYPGGEIRGFLKLATAVPEPGTLAMLALGLPLVGLALRRRGKTGAT
ncbi:CHRD domain-containing protein [Duganella sp. FT80W]|uniref:CHRD domain-containing protein n=1 Tax=Duganella guangzhouensis TaxID=2666084 RepID=A0A6I2L8W0_9BURK|nr:CHRD domain-containing protein [Duganella guangzhouensis]MRW93126.1 CHRD domain-containing protein [Duganella guangzhouensis]